MRRKFHANGEAGTYRLAVQQLGRRARGMAFPRPRGDAPMPLDRHKQLVECYEAGERVGSLFIRVPRPGAVVTIPATPSTHNGAGRYEVVSVTPARHPARFPGDPAPARAEVRRVDDGG